MEIEQEFLSSAAQGVVSPRQTPCEQAKALNQQGLSKDAVSTMANRLPEKDAVKWATASAEKVSNPTHQADWEAIQAAKAWTANPTPDAQNAAALAASKTDFQTPGAWAAQAAAWSGGAGPTPQAVSGAVLLAAAQAGLPIPAQPASAPSLAKPEVAAPKLAAELAKRQAPKFQIPMLQKPAIKVPQVAAPGPDGLSLTPPQRAEMAKNVKPYLELGCEIGSGRTV